MTRYLLDLSAFVHAGHSLAKSRWRELVGDDALIAHPVFAVELLHNATNAKQYKDLRDSIEKGFDWLRPDETTSDIVMRIQERMAATAPAGQRVKTADLMIAALAVQHGHGVLHYDADYDEIRRRGGEPFDSEWLVSRGRLEAVGGKARAARTAYKKAFGERLIQFQDGEDLAVWPELIEWLDRRLAQSGLDVPPPPNVA